MLDTRTMSLYMPNKELPWHHVDYSDKNSIHMLRNLVLVIESQERFPGVLGLANEIMIQNEDGKSGLLKYALH